MMFLLMAGKIFGGSEYETDRAFAEIRKLKPFVQADFTGTIETMISRGEIATAPLDFAAIARLKKRGVNIAAEIPAEGSFAFDQVFNVLKGSEKKAQAHAWIDYILSPEVQLKWARDIYISPANNKVVIPDDVKPLIPLSGEKMSAIVTFDWATVNNNRDRIIERWNKEMV